MNAKRVVIVALIIVSSVAAARWIGGKAFDRRAAPNPDWNERRYAEGEILRVDLDKHEIVLRIGTRLDASELPIAIDDVTRIHLGDEALTLRELRPGDHATVRLATPKARSIIEPHAEEVRLARAEGP